MVYRVEAGQEASTQTATKIAGALGRRAELHLVDPRRRDQRPSLAADPVHSLMGEFETRHFRPIVTGLGLDEPYQHFQFAGRADFVAWRLESAGAHLLHIENRTRFPDFQEMAGSFNAKRAYLGQALAERLGVKRWATETHVIAALWSAEVLHAIRLRTESFRSLGKGAGSFAEWWSGEVPFTGGSEVVVMDPLAEGRQRAWIALDDALTVRPRHSGYADLARKIGA